MIGRITLLWVGLAAGVAAGLFQVKYEVQALEGRLRGAAIHPEIFGSDHCPVELTMA